MHTRPLGRRWLFAIMAAMALPGLTRPVLAEDCPPRQERPQALQHRLAWQVLADVGAIDLFGYAGDGLDPRPLVKRTVGEIRRERAEEMSSREEKLFALGGVTWFAFQDDRLQTADDEVVRIPRAQLWCFVHEGDWVLLSDRVSHHYTQVHKVDRARGLIAFADRWPDRIFLLRNHNEVGVEARLRAPDMKPAIDSLLRFRFPTVDAKSSAAYNQNHVNWMTALEVGKDKRSQVVEITRSEFNRVALAVVTRDTFDVVEGYITLVREPAERARALLSFTAIASRSENVQLSVAEALAVRALESAKAAGDEALRARAAGRVLFVRLLQFYAAAERGNRTEVADHAARLKALERDVPMQTAMRSWVARDFYRAGNAAGRANVLKHAISYFDEAIRLDRSLEAAHLYRAVAKVQIPDYEGARQDIAEALALNAAKTSAVEARKNKQHPKDSAAIRRDDSELAELRERRIAALTQRLALLSRIGPGVLCKEGPRDAEELMIGKIAIGFVYSARCDGVTGRVASARKKLQTAIALEQDPDRRAGFVALLDGLPPD